MPAGAGGPPAMGGPPNAEGSNGGWPGIGWKPGCWPYGLNCCMKGCGADGP